MDSTTGGQQSVVVGNGIRGVGETCIVYIACMGHKTSTAVKSTIICETLEKSRSCEIPSRSIARQRNTTKRSAHASTNHKREHAGHDTRRKCENTMHVVRTACQRCALTVAVRDVVVAAGVAHDHLPAVVVLCERLQLFRRCVSSTTDGRKQERGGGASRRGTGAQDKTKMFRKGTGYSVLGKTTRRQARRARTHGRTSIGVRHRVQGHDTRHEAMNHEGKA